MMLKGRSLFHLYQSLFASSNVFSLLSTSLQVNLIGLSAYFVYENAIVRAEVQRECENTPAMVSARRDQVKKCGVKTGDTLTSYRTEENKKVHTS